jgi:hypothetical protein
MPLSDAESSEFVKPNNQHHDLITALQWIHPKTATFCVLGTLE